MPVQANQTYSAVVREVGLAEAIQKDTPGIFFRFDCGPDGSITHTMYISQNAQSLEIAEKSLGALGVPMAHLADPGFWRAVRAGQPMVGVECEIVTELHEYQGREFVRVKFINARRKEAREGTEDYLAKLFARPGGGMVSAPRSSAQAGGPPPPPPEDGAPSDSEAAQYGSARRRY
jgi:hypothetical protein